MTIDKDTNQGKDQDPGKNLEHGKGLGQEKGLAQDQVTPLISARDIADFFTEKHGIL